MTALIIELRDGTNLVIPIPEHIHPEDVINAWMGETDEHQADDNIAAIVTH